MAFHGGGCSGELPEFGAIFMSNGRTKKECLERQLFGLPLQFVDFVKNIRAGMILFLFEYEKRELYGVFEAISDGSMNIVPHAYHSSGKAFPAQVQIRAVWKCDPLSENRFRDAIKENYYAAYKFNFGLSREQVHRLLLLFDVKRVGPQKYLKQKKVKKRHSRSPDKGCRSIDSGKQIMTKKFRCTPGKSQSTDAQMSNYKSGNTSSPRSEQMELQEEIKQIDIPASHFSDLGDYIPLSSPEHCEHESKLDHKPWIKGLHSDIPEQRRSVFSRLKLTLQGTTQQEKDNSRTLELTESVEKVMQNLQLKHDNWVKMRKKSVTRTFRNIDNSVRQRSSRFSRLSFTSQATGQNTRTGNSCRTMEDASKGKKNRKRKRKHFVSSRDLGNSQRVSLTVQMNTLENRLAIAGARIAKYTTENENRSFEENMTLPAVPSVSCKCRRGEIDRNIDNSVRQRSSVFSRLSFTSEATGQNTRTDNSRNTVEDVSKGKKKRIRAVPSTDHVNSQCISMTVPVNMLENRLAIAEASVAKGTTENENGSFEGNMTLPAVPSASCEHRRGEIEKRAIVEETKLRGLEDAPGVYHKIAESKPFITYKRRKKCLSASSFVKEPAEKDTSDQGEMQQ